MEFDLKKIWLKYGRAGGDSAQELALLAADLLFPRRCPVCGDVVLPKGRLICPGCVKKLSFVTPPVCMKCGKEIDSGLLEYCPDCARRPKSFEYGMALLNYNKTAAASMAAVKYRNKREYLDFLFLRGHSAFRGEDSGCGDPEDCAGSRSPVAVSEKGI